MNVIWKYKIDIQPNIIDMPKGARILCVQTQNEVPCLWALVDPEQPVERIEVDVVGTGHDFPPAGRTYIGTFQMARGQFVFHAFKVERGHAE